MPRPRVRALLSAARQRRVTLVVAGAGYGKTTASADVAAKGASRWVRIRPADAQAESLSARIAAALGESPSPGHAARVPADEGRLRSAIDLWDDVGNPVGAARAELGLAILTDEHPMAAAARRELAAMGVTPALGVAGQLPSDRGSGREVAIIALGRFAVLRSGEPVPLAAWQSRKARDLLKVLVARRGHPITREAAAEAMWPGEDPSRWATGCRSP